MPVAVALWLITIIPDKKLRIMHAYTAWWARFLIFINPYWKVVLLNNHKLVKNEPVVFIANHQSMVDILVLYKLPVSFKWIAKKELFRTPVIGWMLWLNNYIKVDRSDLKSMKNMLKIAANKLEKGNSLMIFPEGTRSKNGVLQSFKDGAFRIAYDSQKHIQPIIISGATKALPKHSWFLKNKSVIVIDVLDCVYYQNYKNQSTSVLKESIHRGMQKKIN